MRAYGADHKKLFTTTNEDQRFAPCVAEHHRSFGQARKRHALREIGPYIRVLRDVDESARGQATCCTRHLIRMASLVVMAIARLLQ